MQIKMGVDARRRERKRMGGLWWRGGEREREGDRRGKETDSGLEEGYKGRYSLKLITFTEYCVTPAWLLAPGWVNRHAGGC